MQNKEIFYAKALLILLKEKRQTIERSIKDMPGILSTEQQENRKNVDNGLTLPPDAPPEGRADIHSNSRIDNFPIHKPR
jgi:hypothetical protein